MNEKSKYVRNFDSLTLSDVPLVGGKNASLGELRRELGTAGVRVPAGFAVTAEGYRLLLRSAGLERLISEALQGLDTNDLQNLSSRGRRIRDAIANAPLPPALEQEILAAYEELSCDSGGPAAHVAVRSSATAEDLPNASFAGQQETYLNVCGGAAILDACRRCFASLFTDRAISYRVDQGFDHLQVALSIGVQQMVRSDLGSSGVMFTVDTETGFRDVVLVNAAYGLGEYVVKGTINPDEFYVHKPTLLRGYKPILQRRLGTKESKLVYDDSDPSGTRDVLVEPQQRGQFAINDEDLLSLARWACLIEQHYSQKRGRDCPMDIEWAKDGLTGELFVLQARPETVQSQRAHKTVEIYKLQQTGRVLTKGRSIGEKIACGPARIIQSAGELSQFQPGEVLVAEKTDPDWEPAMKNATAIVTNRGGRTCHAAILSRELGLPAVVGCEDATGMIGHGQKVTVSCAEGEVGKVYDGQLAFSVDRLDLDAAGSLPVKIMLNMGNPAEAFKAATLPNDGVGLARLEFIISSAIRIHPMALVRYPHLQDAQAVEQIDHLTGGYCDKPQYFVDRLAEGVAMIAAAFYPRDVIVRLSDFKTNEYANLIGGREFEPVEENPMLGFRGASRYYDEKYREGFALECRAMRKVREDMGLKNVKVMVPFCRTLDEARRVIAELHNNGLKRGEKGLELYVMCEIPSNVILAREFAELFDGFSIGSNDLTQLVLGVDRDSETIAHLFDERNDAVKTMLAMVIHAARDAGRKIGICGQAPSDYPELAAFLVEQGIQSLSLSPDAVLKTILHLRKYGCGGQDSSATSSGQPASQPELSPHAACST